jgi:hypothetical protein
LQRGRTIVMGYGLVGDLGSEVVSKYLEVATFAPNAGFADADCLDVVGDLIRETTATGAARSTPTRSTSTSTSSRWWCTATAAGRGSRRHGRRLQAVLGVADVNRKATRCGGTRKRT